MGMILPHKAPAFALGAALLLSGCLGGADDTIIRTGTSGVTSPSETDTGGANNPPNNPGNGSGNDNGNSNAGGNPPNPPVLFRAASMQYGVDPTVAQIKGVVDATPVVGRIQQFNLGGYGGFAFNGPSDVVNFDIGGPPATGLGDGTFVRVFVLENNSSPSTRLVFVTIDAIGAGNVIQNALKAAVSQAAGVPANNVLFAQTHSHSAADLQGLWGGVPAGWLDCAVKNDATACDPAVQEGMYQLAAKATREAVAKLQPVDLEFAQAKLEGEDRLNNFRRCNPEDTKQPDPFLTVLTAKARNGKTVGALLNYSAHPTVLGSSNRLVHTDWVGGALRTLEREWGSTVLFYNGAIADSSPRAPAGSDAYERANALGVKVAQAAKQALLYKKKINEGLNVQHAEALLPLTNPLFIGAALLRSFNQYYNFTPAGPQLAAAVPMYNTLPQAALYAQTPVSRIRLGSADNAALELVTIPGEASRGFADALRARSATPMMLMGLTHNSFGYILTETEFGDGVFECQSSYEETVSLGPLTTPALNLQAYGPLFSGN